MSIGEIFDASIDALSELPYLEIVGAAIAAFVIGMVWYGFLFNKQYMELTGKKKDEPTNWCAMACQFLGLLVLALLIGVLSLYEETYWLAIVGLLGVTKLMMLSGTLFNKGNNKKAMKLFEINSGAEMISILVISLMIYLI